MAERRNTLTAQSFCVITGRFCISDRHCVMSSQARSQAASREDARHTAGQRDLDKRCIDTIRTLAIDAVEKANSGHAGTPMDLAPVAYTLWQRFLRYDPAEPLWASRDRFGRTTFGVPKC